MTIYFNLSSSLSRSCELVKYQKECVFSGDVCGTLCTVINATRYFHSVSMKFKLRRIIFICSCTRAFC